MLRQQSFPKFVFSSEQAFERTITVILLAESGGYLAQEAVADFTANEKTTIGKHTFLTIKQCKKYSITHDCNVEFSKGVENLPSYSGLASGLLASAYSFNVKTVNPPPSITISLSPKAKDVHLVIGLASASIRSAILANGRGDMYGSPDYFVQKSKEISGQLGMNLKTLIQDQLKEEGLNLFHSVGRGSSKDTALINLSYNGNPNSDSWIAFIGKGVCFDSGGLDLKGTNMCIKSMFLDKSGACSCFAAIEQIAREKLPINVTATLGMVENFISKNSYRPADIITSKKGLTVEIADTDAEGRLVLADCMTWTQMNYNISKMIELSTLTYSIIAGLGHGMAGIFGNSQHFSELLRQTGEEVQERCWIMPLEESHQDFLISKVADLLSDANDTAPGASIAAAFLENFVEKGVEWIHLDVAGPCMNLEESRGTGYGARLLLQLVRKLAGEKFGS